MEINEKKIIVNANIITMAEENQRYQALAIEDGIITALGAESEIAHLMDQGFSKENFQGRTVLPGFIDTHEHLMATGFQETSVHLDMVKTIDEILELMSERAGITPEGDWVYGSYLNEQNIREKTMPTKEDLDRAIPNHPVLITHITRHMCAFNTKAFEILNPPFDLKVLIKKAAALLV